VLGVLIFIHELGHFAVAKWVGVRVEKFSLGFGKKIFGFKRGDTEYLVSMLPLGGYVKMAGDEPDEEREGASYEFLSKTVFERAAIVVAGPIMNIVLAAILMVCPYIIGVAVEKYMTEPVKVSWMEKGSLAEKSGIKLGDTIDKVNGETVNVWADYFNFLASGETVETVTVQRDLGTKLIKIPAQEASSYVHFGIHPFTLPKVGGLQGGMPAANAGIEVGDVVVAIDGEAVATWSEMAEIISSKGGQDVVLTLSRNGKTLSKPIIPKLNEKLNKGFIGITPYSEMRTVSYPVSVSVSKGMRDFKNMSLAVFKFLKTLVSGEKEAFKNLGGPIMIYQVTGVVAKSGFTSLLKFMGFLSLQLGILNLFPIPVLDGGHLLFYGIELVRRKPISQKKQELVQNVGMALLLFMIVAVSYNDIIRAQFFDKLLEWAKSL